MENVKEKPEKRGKEDEKPHTVVRNAADYQRLKLEKLMKNPEKPVIIPERPKGKGAPHVPDFVRNVMGSSAGAGSGEFHVYRHLRRKEYARQKYMQEKATKEDLDVEYQKKLEENQKQAEERTAKKRAKRLKKKQKQKNIKKIPGKEKKQESSSSESSESENEEKEENSGNTEKDDQTKTKEDIVTNVSNLDTDKKDVENINDNTEENVKKVDQTEQEVIVKDSVSSSIPSKPDNVNSSKS